MAKKKNKAEVDRSEDQPSTFEESISQLSEMVRELEEGTLSLDESLERYEQGIRHLKRCQKILATAERKIEILSGMDADGNATTQQFDDEEMTLQQKADQRSRRRTARPKSKSAPRKAASKAKPGEELSQDDVDADGTLF